MKYIITQVPFGDFDVTGLMNPETGEFAIASTQVSDILQLRKSDASRNIKTLLGKGFKLSKSATEITNNKIQVLTLEEFTLVIQAAAKKGNPQAMNLAILLMGLSLTQLWADAFGIKFEKEERQNWLVERMKHRKDYHDRFTPWTKHDLEQAKVFDKKKQAIVYGARMNALKQKANLPLKFVGHYDLYELSDINDVELRYHTMRELGLTHQEVMDRL